jgi:Tol biopolymer transport system component
VAQVSPTRVKQSGPPPGVVLGIVLAAQLALVAFALAGRAPAMPASTALPTMPPAQTDARTIAFAGYASGERDLYVVHADGSGLTRVAGGPGTYMEHPDWSPDGTRIAYHAGHGPYRSYSVWVMNADGSGQTRLTRSSLSGLWPTWSPDGSHIAFSHYDLDIDALQIWVMDADGGNARPVTTPAAGSDVFPTWTPNGTILFLRLRTTLPQGRAACPGDVIEVRPDGTGLVYLTLGATVGNYALSPDGTEIAVHDTELGRVVVLPTDGRRGSQRTLVGTRVALGDPVDPVTLDLAQCPVVAPAWSPAGDAVAIACSDWGAYLDGSGFHGVRAAGSGFYVVSADGSRIAPVPNAANGYDPAWRPR